MLNLRKCFISTTVLSSSRNSIFFFYNLPLLIYPHISYIYCSPDFFELFVNGSLQTCISKTVNLRSFFFFNKFNAWVSSGIVSFNFFFLWMGHTFCFLVCFIIFCWELKILNTVLVAILEINFSLLLRDWCCFLMKTAVISLFSNCSKLFW